jgi:hypothetical protein
MKVHKLLAATAVAGLASVPSFADTLILNDGSRLQGTLVSMNRQTVVFDEDQGSSYNTRARTRRVRVPLERVDAIDFTDGRFNGDDSWSSNDPWSNNDDYYGNNSGSWPAGNMRSRTVSVYANRQWTDTGINVRAGDVIRFDPTGTIEWGPGRQDGPAGEYNSPYNRNRPLPNQAGGALIGRIGTGSGDMFLVGGDRGTFRARTSGRLYLGVNDDHLQDNSGAFRVVVEHQ